MSLSSFIFIAFLNLLISVVIAFVTTGLLKRKCLGGFWGALIIAIVGSLVGTVLGIYFGNHRIILDLAIIRFLFPLVGAMIAVFIYVVLHGRTQND